MRTEPDFIILGAMKCATSSLHDQLAVQSGFVMSEPKEPNFFSNDEEFARGMDWYHNLFAAAGDDDLCGESSTHYTKLPTYPKTIERIQEHAPNAKFIYVMRHPINRLVSQYIHEWSQKLVSSPIDQAIDDFPEMVAYSRYAMQIQPFFDAFGKDRVLPIFFERLTKHSQAELDRVADFLELDRPLTWKDDLDASNISSKRMRKSPLRDAIVNAPVLSTIRKRLIPRSFRNWIKGFWQMNNRPELSDKSVERLKAIFDEDLAQVGEWLGVELNCDNYKEVVIPTALDWTVRERECV